jgi:FkbM family methyltransferase
MFYNKYIKYKKKYLQIKENINLIGGAIEYKSDFNDSSSYELQSNSELYKLQNILKKRTIIKDTDLDFEYGYYDVTEFSRKDKPYLSNNYELPSNKCKFYTNIKKEPVLKTNYEFFEQYIMLKFIKPTDIVLELGGNIGVISTIINNLVNNKDKHVVVETNHKTVQILEKNKQLYESQFQICNKAISNDKLYLALNNDNYADVVFKKNETHLIYKLNEENKYPELNNLNELVKKNLKKNIKKIEKIENITINDFFNIYNYNFNTLVADCEGCLCDLLPLLDIQNRFYKIIFERDNEDKCSGENIKNILETNNFIKVYQSNYDFQQVWINKSKCFAYMDEDSLYKLSNIKIDDDFIYKLYGGKPYENKSKRRY